MSERSYTLSFPQLARTIAARETETLFQSARRAGLRIVGACGGRGSCGTCVVRVVAGEVEHQGENQGEGGGDKKWLRACRVRARSDCTLEVAPRSLAPVVRAEAALAGGTEVLAVDTLIAARDIVVDAPSLTDPQSDLERVRRALGANVDRVDLAAARQLPGLLRQCDWSLRARLRGDELIGFAPAGSPSLGLAVDLGTTNVAAFLIDLDSGARLASLGIENPQVAWGADVISRINHAVRQPEGGEELRLAACSAIEALAHDLCRAVGAGTGDIVDLAVCGNTAMHHLLLGLPVSQLGRAPFVAALRDGMDLKARDLGLSFCPGAMVHIAPNVGGFVGGDHVTALLATEERWRAEGPSLVMDIGTNTEITLIHDGRFLSASCPSGPALEGGHISCGMRAAEGAIERVSLVDGRIAVAVIGDQEPVGLCGSGVLDALATLHRAGIVDHRGRIAGEHPDVLETAAKRVAVLAPGVHFTQDDVRAVQLAKAAIRAGVEMLLTKAGLQERELERFIIAGAFGAYLDVASGIATGLFPDLPPARFHQVGNAAGLGIRQMLASERARSRAAELAAACRYVELSTIAGFQKCFIKHIGFPSYPAMRKSS
ncbi:MAG TPA: ASKHA domain-containing protein [Rhodocyclaceae bacterium]|nr:ASKHA domain-containing protein [Rhodocyclaceae bacterium]